MSHNYCALCHQTCSQCFLTIDDEARVFVLMLLPIFFRVAQSGYAEGTSRVNRAYKVDVDDEVAETGEPSDELSKPLNTDSGSNSAGKTNVISHEED